MKKIKREKIGFAGSVAVHIAVFLLLAFAGVFQTVRADSGVTEVMVFGGGGGGGGQGGAEAVEVEQQEAAPAADEDPDAITEQGKKEEPKPQPRPAQVKKSAAKAAAVKGAAGSGGGQGTGHGTGTGSGTGPGKGSGSGGGTGSGHGRGVGSGFGDGIATNPAVPPRVVRSVSPVYPESQRLTNVDGVVRLRLLIGTDGTVEDVAVMASSGSRPLDNAAVNACRRWKFTPAKNAAGQIVRCYWDLPIRFNLNH